ncbi:hypothetical protein DFA_06989 [Cavenderia fasciculata]|uniref:Uncharacterized protein n=1 Tax=Cavenderia fasciculata TaxID=261658 RepID=F4PX83_CACFS|nr:uncharacterized protein DFA_06989 [Cavenderia fasciculata]EGG19886.1 hypothetical protein DFA_06989 [Cavenderia fasciculata]|eukprot:XP_004366869.1 hypothetical protein DFA_06989 [Cavenderia fasciculata]
MNFYKLHVDQVLSSVKYDNQFKYQSLEYQGVWIQGIISDVKGSGNGTNSSNSMSVDDDDIVDNKSNVSGTLSTGSLSSDLTMSNFQLDDGTADGVFILIPDDIMNQIPFNLSNGQYVIVLGSLEEESGQEKFVVANNIINLSHNTRTRKKIWDLQLKHIHQTVYGFTTNDTDNNNNNDNLKQQQQQNGDDIDEINFDYNDDPLNGSSIMVGGNDIDSDQQDEEEDVESIQERYFSQNNDEKDNDQKEQEDEQQDEDEEEEEEEEEVTVSKKRVDKTKKKTINLDDEEEEEKVNKSESITTPSKDDNQTSFSFTFGDTSVIENNEPEEQMEEEDIWE